MHSEFCPHAESAPRDYVERAIALGMSELGFAEHPPVPTGWRLRHDVTDDWAMAWDDVDDYVTVVRDLATEYAAEVRVVPGIEADFLEDALDETAAALAEDPFDYVIASVHVVGDRFGCDHRELRDQVPAEEPYQSPALPAQAHDLGIPLVFAADAHRPADVGAVFQRTAAVARAAGYTETLLFAGTPAESLS